MTYNNSVSSSETSPIPRQELSTRSSLSDFILHSRNMLHFQLYLLVLNRKKKKNVSFFTQATKQYSYSANWSILILETSVLRLCLPEIIYKKIRELYLVENNLHRGSGSTKFDCRLQKCANRREITTPFHALGCKFEEIQNTCSSLTEVPAGNGCEQINPGMAIFHSFEKTSDEWGKINNLTAGSSWWLFQDRTIIVQSIYGHTLH